MKLKKELELFQKTFDDMEDPDHYVINASLSEELAHDLITIWIIAENYFVLVFFFSCYVPLILCYYAHLFHKIKFF